MQGAFLFKSDTSNRKRQSIQRYLDDFPADNYICIGIGIGKTHNCHTKFESLIYRIEVAGQKAGVA
jgi:hypothetical protein